MSLSITSRIILLISLSVLMLGLFVSKAISDTKSKETIMKSEKEEKYNSLTPEEESIIEHKGTERPFTGEYYKHDKSGAYLCKRCNAKLYESTDKFDTDCGWPGFDDAVTGAVTETTDADGRRTEITCTNCGGHLGHVFRGEQLTDKNTRHCVNSLSINFKSESTEAETERAYFAGGCFWGTEYFLQQEPGVISTSVGYMGGDVDDPSYEQVCSGTTGHTETVEIVFDPSKITYEKLARVFFEIHDPAQVNRQGPDIGPQYRSAVFYTDENQKATIEKLIGLLKDSGFEVATENTSADKFWSAEVYHQDYYQHNGSLPYCHAPKKRFKD